MRSLARAPVFTIVVTVTLAVAIAANATVLGILDKLFLRKLPVPDPSRIVALARFESGSAQLQSAGNDVATILEYRGLRERVGGVTGLATYVMTTVPAGDPIAGDVWSALISGNYFRVLEVRPQLGRLIDSTDDTQPGANPIVVISDHLWRTLFNGDASVVGQHLRLAKTDFTIVGVAPRDFTGLHAEGRTDLWIPLTMQEEAMGRAYQVDRPTFRHAHVFGRLLPGVGVGDLQTRVDAAVQDMLAPLPPAQRDVVFRARIRDRLLDYRDNPRALALFATIWMVIGLVTLVAGSNVSSLMLTRLAAVKRDLGVRLCLGASRTQVVYRSVLEALLLIVPGTILGLAGTRWLTIMATSPLFMSALDAGMNVRVVAIVCVIAALTILQFVFIPALEASRVDPVALIRGIEPSGARKRRDASRTTILGQLVVSMMLLVNTVAFIGMLRQQQERDLGYDPEDVVVATIAPRSAQPSHVSGLTLYDDVMARVAAIPGVSQVAAAGGAPLRSARLLGELRLTAEKPRGVAKQRSFQLIGPNYFVALRARIVAGREFTNAERTRDGRGGRFDVVVINRSLARELWPDRSPIGEFVFSGDTVRAQVIGIVHDIVDVSTLTEIPRAYFPLLESQASEFEIVVRTQAPIGSTIRDMRSALESLGTVARPTIRTLSGVIEDAQSLAKSSVRGLLAAAALALGLTAIGLYGVVAMWATKQRRELAIRMAVGAGPRRIYSLLLSEVLQLVAAGAVVGAFFGFGLVQVERSSLGPALAVGVWPALGAAITLATIAGLAVLVPVLRALHLPLATVLRGD